MLENRFGIGIKSELFDAMIFGEHAIESYEQSFGIDTSFSNSFVGAKINWLGTGIAADATFKLGVAGYRTGDIDLLTSLIKNIGENSLDANFYFHVNEAIISDVNYTSNHFMWRNYSLDKQGLMGLSVAYELKKYLSLIHI